MKILVVGPSWVGDMVMAQSLFIALQTKNSPVDIHVLAPAWCEALLAYMPQVSKAIAMPVGHGELSLGKRRMLAKALKAENYDQAIVLPNSFKSALVPWFAGIPQRTGWRGEARSWILNDCRVLDKSQYPLMIERFVALAYARDAVLTDSPPWPKINVSEQEKNLALGKLGLETGLPTLVLCPGAEFGEAKKWPAQSYGEVARKWLSKNGQVWILGSASDCPDAEKIISTLGNEEKARCADVTGKTSLGEAIALMACADKVISNDSGLMHIAAALERPLVVVYGSTSPGFTPPLAENVATVNLQLECSPCFKRICPLGHTNCLRQLPPSMVDQALQGLA